MNTLSLLSNSSDNASFKASRTVTSLEALSDAYVRRYRMAGAQADCLNAGRTGDAMRDWSRRAAGRKIRGAAISRLVVKQEAEGTDTNTKRQEHPALEGQFTPKLGSW